MLRSRRISAPLSLTKTKAVLVFYEFYGLHRCEVRQHVVLRLGDLLRNLLTRITNLNPTVEQVGDSLGFDGLNNGDGCV